VALRVQTARVDEREFQNGNNRGTPRLFFAKSAPVIGKRGDAFCSLQERQRAKVMRPWRSVPAHRQSRWLSKQRVAGRQTIVVKTEGDSKCAQIWARRTGLSRRSGNSEVGQFEWSLITLVSVAWRLLLSQNYFISIRTGLRKRPEKKNQRQNQHP